MPPRVGTQTEVHPSRTTGLTESEVTKRKVLKSQVLHMFRGCSALKHDRFARCQWGPQGMGAMDWQEAGLTHWQGNLWPQTHYHGHSPSEQGNGELGHTPHQRWIYCAGNEAKVQDPSLVWSPEEAGSWWEMQSVLDGEEKPGCIQETFYVSIFKKYIA